jgi:hypothetical protein
MRARLMEWKKYMPIKPYWIEEPFIIGVDCSGHISIEDINGAASNGLKFVDNNQLYMLLDLTNNSSLPRNLINLSFRSGEWSQLIQHPNMMAFAFISARPSLQLAADTAIRDTDLGFFEDYEEGLAFLREKMAEESQEFGDSPAEDGIDS